MKKDISGKKIKALIGGFILLIIVFVIIFGVWKINKGKEVDKSIPAKTENLSVGDLEKVKNEEIKVDDSLLVENSTKELVDEQIQEDVKIESDVVSENTLSENKIETKSKDLTIKENDEKISIEDTSIWKVEREDEIPSTTKEIGYDMYQYFKGRAKDEGIRLPEDKELESYIENEFMDNPETISPVEIEMLITTLKSMNYDMYEDYLKNGAKEDISFFGE